MRHTNQVTSIDKFVSRQGTKPRIYGVHESLFKSNPGVSHPGFYVRERMNLETVKRIHREELECIRILQQRIRLVA